MNTTEFQTLVAARDALMRTARGGKAEVIGEAAAVLKCSVATLYRKLEQAGLDTGRKRRADAGTSDMTLPELRLVSGLLFTSRRDNDKQLLTVQDALDMLDASDQLRTRLSPQRVGMLLRQHGLHPEQLAQPKPATELRSLHPNHVWGIDSSTCVLYYMKSGHLAAMDVDTFYANKPANLAKVMHDLCTRYIVVDHFSGAMKVRYYMGGETAYNLVDFFIHGVVKQPLSPMHGVPRLLVLDRGPGNTSHLFQNLAKRVDSRVIYTGVGNPRAKGFVEKPQDIVERHFEGRFRFLPAEELTLESINDLAQEWTKSFCSTRKHSRTGEARYSTWMRIEPDELRVAAEEVLRELATHEPEQPRVSNFRTISFVPRKGHERHEYDLTHVPGVNIGARVTVAVNAFRCPAIDVRWVDADTGEELWQTVEPVQRGEGRFRIDAPVIGEEYRTAAYTAVDRQRNRITQEAYAKPGDGMPSLEEAARARKAHAQAYAGTLDAMADVRATVVPSYLPRRSTELQPPPVRTMVATVLSTVDACRRLKERMGASYSPQVYAHVAQHHPAGVPEDQLDAIAALFTPQQPVVENRFEGLRAVGGTGGAA